MLPVLEEGRGLNKGRENVLPAGPPEVEELTPPPDSYPEDECSEDEEE